jgi:hypothetical protein
MTSNDRFVDDRFVVANDQQQRFKIVRYSSENADDHRTTTKKKWKFDIEIKELHERCEIRRRIDRDVKARRKTRREILQFEDDQIN